MAVPREILCGVSCILRVRFPAVDGEEALAAVKSKLEDRDPFQLICLDIMMPRLDGQATLNGLRQLEEAHGIPLGMGAKVVMTTCLKDSHHIMDSFRKQCDAYIVKPITSDKLSAQLAMIGVLKDQKAPSNRGTRATSVAKR